MITLVGLYLLLGFPVRILVQIIMHVFFGSPYRKLKHSLLQSLKMTLCRTALLVPVPDIKYMNFMLNSFLVRKLLPFEHGRITRTLSSYGEQYDEHSIWLNKAKDGKGNDPIIIYLHGGGYWYQTSPFQLHGLLSIYKLLTPERQKNTSLLLLDYKLAGDGYPLPYQLNQLMATYEKLLSEGNTNIILVGDSAGGNLTLGFLQTVAARNRQVSEKLIYPKKVVLVSPWVKLQPTRDQYKPGRLYYENRNIDVIEYNHIRHPAVLEGLILTTIEAHPDPLIISPHSKLPHLALDWDDIDTFRKPDYDVLIILGEDETFRDDILDWSLYALGVPLNKNTYGDSENKSNPAKHEYTRERGENSPHVRVFVEPWGVHDSLFIFENAAIRDLTKNPKLTPEDLPETYFGIKRVAQFLNETL